jgi:hypothetical protein
MSKFKDDIAEIMADTTIKNKNEAINKRVKEYNQNDRIIKNYRIYGLEVWLIGLATGLLLSILLI